MKHLANICGVVAFVTIVFMAAGRENSPENPVQAKKDTEALQGKWQVTFHEEKGVKTPADGVHTLTVMGNTIHQMHEVPNGADFQYSFKLDSTKNPTEVDLTIIKAGNEKDKGEVGKSVLGIYMLDGVNLKLCTDPSVRPTTFETKGKPRETVLLVLKRQQK
jgi:uncharacterized protein (TIGR03067 family)